VNYTVNAADDYSSSSSSIVGQTINGVMKVYGPNKTLIKTSAFPTGFTANISGTQ
jgi:hypothetical protein